MLTAWQRTVTPMGARLLRDWLSQPLTERAAIERRQDAVADALACPAELEAIRTSLREVRDLERTLGRLSAGSGSGRDLVALRLGLQQVPALAERVLSIDGAGGVGAGAEDADAGISLFRELVGMLSPAGWHRLHFTTL